MKNLVLLERWPLERGMENIYIYMNHVQRIFLRNYAPCKRVASYIILGDISIDFVQRFRILTHHLTVDP